ncbi:MAG: ABC transporter permease [Anaerolineales bacterium]|nr:ABC transporter permease [Anaerolineales bacterium]
MIRAELKKYFQTRLFWVLNAVGLGLLVIYSLLVTGMERVGLQQVTAFDYLIGSVNIYVTSLLPVLVCLFAAYAFASEYQWRTLMIPLVEGRSRSAVLWGKAALCALTTLAFAAIYLIFALGFAFGLFSAQDMLLENRVISPLEAVLRIATATAWIALITFVFGLAAMVLAARFRHPLLASAGSLLLFFIFLMTADVRRNPFAPLLQVPRLLVQSANLSDPAFGLTVLQGVGVWVAVTGVILGVFFIVFHRQDIVFE